MKKLERLDEATSPDGTVLTLFRHDGAYSIRVDGVERMSTRRHHSEEKLAELVAGGIAWNRNPAYDLAASALDDSRVDLRQDDVARVLQQSRGQFDAIMLDVDTGAEPMTHEGNAQLYRYTGITWHTLFLASAA